MNFIKRLNVVDPEMSAVAKWFKLWNSPPM